MEKKKVTKEFIKRWNETLLSGYKLENIHGKKDYSFALEMMLREIGVEVVGKKNE